MRRLPRALVAALFVLPLAPSPAFAAGAPRGCGVRYVASGTADSGGRWTPVVFVHGITDGGDRWDKDIDSSSASLPQTVARLRGVAAYTFDYGPYSLEWVTHPKIGPRLATSIACLARESGRKVVVVAHSMGGLATRQAAAQPDGDGRAGRHLAAVVTIGTPYEGSAILTLAARGADTATARFPNPVTLTVRSVMATCGLAAREWPRNSPCSLLGVPDTPAGRALRVGSAQLRALPDWPSNLPVHALASELTMSVRIGVWKLAKTIHADVGDVAVMSDSARAGDTTSERLTDACDAEGLDDIRRFTSNDCYHGNLPTERPFTDRTVAIVRDVVKGAERAERGSAAGGAASVTSIVLDVSSSMLESDASGETKLDAAVRATGDVLDLIEAQGGDEGEHAAGLVTFSEDASERVAVTPDVDRLRETLSGVSTEGGTNIGEGLSRGIQQLRGGGGVRSLILLSDGATNRGRSPTEILDELAPLASSEGVKVFTIAFGDAASGNALDTDLLTNLASRTGGAYSTASTPLQLRAAFLRARHGATGSILGDIHGSVRQDATVDATSMVVPDHQGRLEASLVWPGSTLDLELVDPAGRPVTSDYPGAEVLASGNPAIVMVDDPRPGLWRVRVRGRDVTGYEEEFHVIAAVQPSASRDDGGLPPLALGAGLLLVGSVAGALVDVALHRRRRVA